jgi:hypothetical protein
VFVIAMDAPAWAHDLTDRNGLTLALRELAFCGGALALASSRMRAIARYFIAVPVLVYSVAVVEGGSLSSFNFVADTLMFAGAVLLLGGAQLRE